MGEGERDEREVRTNGSHNAASRALASSPPDVHGRMSIHGGERSGDRTTVFPRGRSEENAREEGVVAGGEFEGRAFHSSSPIPPPLLGIFRVLGLRAVSRGEEEVDEEQTIDGVVGRGSRGREGAGVGRLRRSLLIATTGMSSDEHRSSAGGEASTMFRTPEAIDAWCPAIPFSRLAASTETNANSLVLRDKDIDLSEILHFLFLFFFFCPFYSHISVYVFWAL